MANYEFTGCPTAFMHSDGTAKVWQKGAVDAMAGDYTDRLVGVELLIGSPEQLNPINWIRCDTQTGVSGFYNCTGEYITDKTEHDLNTKVWTDGSFIPNVGETYRIYLPNAPYVLYLSQATHAYVGQVVEGDPSPRSSNFCYVIYDDSKHTYGCKSAQFSNNPSEIGQNIGKYSVAVFDDEHQLRDGDYIELKYLGVDEETKLPQIQITHPAGLNTTTDIILFYPERKYLNVSLESPANKSATSSYYPIVPLRVVGVNTDFTPLYDACT